MHSVTVVPPLGEIEMSKNPVRNDGPGVRFNHPGHYIATLAVNLTSMLQPTVSTPIADCKIFSCGPALLQAPRNAPLPFQPAKFDLFVRAKRAYSNNVFHGDTSRGENHNTPLEVSYFNRPLQLRKSPISRSYNA